MFFRKWTQDTRIRLQKTGKRPGWEPELWEPATTDLTEWPWPSCLPVLGLSFPSTKWQDQTLLLAVPSRANVPGFPDSPFHPPPSTELTLPPVLGLLASNSWLYLSVSLSVPHSSPSLSHQHQLDYEYLQGQFGVGVSFVTSVVFFFFFWVIFLFILSRNLNQDEDFKTILYGNFIHSPLLSLKLGNHSVSLSKSKSSTVGLASLINEPVATHMCQSVYETPSQERSVTHWLLAFHLCSATFY